MSRCPNPELINNVIIIDDDNFQFPWVEIFMEINQNSDSCERDTRAFTVEFFPHGKPKGLDLPETVNNAPESEPCVRLLQPEMFDEEEKQRFKNFAAVVGRITYYDP